MKFTEFNCYIYIIYVNIYQKIFLDLEKNFTFNSHNNLNILRGYIRESVMNTYRKREYKVKENK